MELFQVFWDDQQKLFLEFKKDNKEKEIYTPQKIKYLNIHFEISKILTQDIFHKQPPIIISIKKIYHSNECLSFPIELDDFRNSDDLQIKILRLIIFLRSGHRVEYIFTEKLNLSDVWINEDCYVGYNLEDLGSKNRFRQTITKEKLYEEIQKDYENNKEKKTIVVEKQKIENVVESNSLVEMIRENNDTLKVIANEIRNLTAVLKNFSFNNPASGYIPPGPPIRRSNESGIERIKKPPSKPMIMQIGSSAKVLVIKEMKEKFTKVIEKNNGFNVKDILKPMSEEELRSLTLNEEELKKKEEEAIKKQIERFKKEQQKKLSLVEQ
ncbi:MAG: hypothetical protein ACFFDX_15350 [Candidatus Odinarchaeota archaeon]